jgi:hypothetical protein
VTIWDRVQGDVNDTIEPILSGVVDLTEVTVVRAFVRRRGVVVELTGSVVDAVLCKIRLQLSTNTWLQTAEPGEWLLQSQLTFLSGRIATFPSGEPDKIVVHAQNDATP